ncbi:hypothetical protein V8E36_001617 [Tilletia maclaganii]
MAAATSTIATNGPPADPSGPFEGPEKLLELWFRPSSSSSSSSLSATNSTLRAVERDTWQTILNTVSCTILSVIHSDDSDAYLLSESSMFVFDHKLILKTCGTTTLLYGLEHILHLAHHILGAGSSSSSTTTPQLAGAAPTEARQGAQLVERIFYSRKSFMFPDRQKGPHKDWMLEVALLDDFFADGAAYTVGKMNGDHWLLYMASQAKSDPSLDSAPSSSRALPAAATVAPVQAQASSSGLEQPPYNDNEDQTLEILMTQLDPAATQAFYYSSSAPAADDSEADAPTATALNEVPSAHSNQNGHLTQPASTKGGAASTDEPVDNDEEADPGSISLSAALNGSLPNGSVGHAIAAEEDRGHTLGDQTSTSIGLASLFSTGKLDAFAFEPCGYSANALITPSPDGAVRHTAGYWTVHVTPEPECSYASFETNVRFLPGSSSSSSSSSSSARASGAAAGGQGSKRPHDLASLIRRVVQIFQPGKMSITLFLSSSSSASDEAEETTTARLPAAPFAVTKAAQAAETNAMALDALVLGGYRRTDRILYEFEGYDLTFATFERAAAPVAVY